MRTTAIILFLILTMSAFLNAQAPGDSVFAGIKVHEIKLEFSQTAYWDSLTAYYNDGKEQDLMAKAVVDGVVFDSISVRFKAGASYNYPTNKKPFRITFGDHIKDQRWDGLKGIHLNNCYGDPTFMREKLHLDFCRDAGITAPRGNFAVLYINGESFGLYSLVEHVDKRFLASHFDKDNGNLYKAVDGVDGKDTYVSDLKWYGNNISEYQKRYELKTDAPENPWTDLIKLIDTLNNSASVSSSLGKVFNLNSYYKALAADILLANLDSYLSGGRNYFLYYLPSTGKFEWIVWDANLSMGGYDSNAGKPDTLSVFYVKKADERPLLNKIYNDPVLRDGYLSTLCILMKEHFIPEEFYNHIYEITSVIFPYVEDDPKKQFTYEQFLENLVQDVTLTGPGGGFKPGLTSFARERSANLVSQLNALGYNCEFTIHPGDLVINEFLALNNYIKDFEGETDDWIELRNNTDLTLDISGLYLSDNPAMQKKWRIPDNTLITSKSYIIIWADEQVSRYGLHANFKLAAEGETLILSNKDGSLLDSVSFGQQTLNRSMSRIPDGTGSFVQTTPTFEKANTNVVSVEEKKNSSPSIFDLKQNYPNPFNPTTMISFSVNKSGWTQLRVYNALGEQVTTLFEGNAEAGSQYKVRFDASGLSGGIYFYRLANSEQSLTKRMALIK